MELQGCRGRGGVELGCWMFRSLPVRGSAVTNLRRVERRDSKLAKSMNRQPRGVARGRALVTDVKRQGL